MIVVAIAVTGVLLVGAGVAAVRYGAGALDLGGGYVQSIRSTGKPVWIGLELQNRSAVPLTLAEFVPRGTEHLRITGTRVIDLHDGNHLGMLTEPLVGDADLREAIDAGVPVDGFVLPAGSTRRYQLAIRVQRSTLGHQAVLAGGSVVYRALGIDQGASTDGVSCIRAPNRSGCPPY